MPPYCCYIIARQNPSPKVNIWKMEKKEKWHFAYKTLQNPLYIALWNTPNRSYITPSGERVSEGQRKYSKIITYFYFSLSSMFAGKKGLLRLEMRCYYITLDVKKPLKVILVLSFFFFFIYKHLPHMSPSGSFLQCLIWAHPERRG